MSKINKLGKSTFVIAILSLILVAVLSFGGTYAYFSAKTDAVTGTVTMGKLHIDAITGGVGESNKLTIDSKIVQPNQEILNQTFKATADTNIAYYTRVTFTVVATPKADATHSHVADPDTDCDDYFANAVDALDIVTPSSSAWGQDGTSGVFYKLAPTAADATSKEESFAVKITAKAILGQDGCTYWMDATIQISIKFEVLQADYLTSSTATGAAFTDAAAAKTAWEAALSVAKS